MKTNKTNLKNLFPGRGVALLRSRACLAVALRRPVLPALIAVINLLPAGRAAAQTFTTTFTTLHYFAGFPDGAGPAAGLILSGNTLYGTTQVGGSSGGGTVFAGNTDGTGFMALHGFTGVSPSVYPEGTNTDGANPMEALLLSGSTLYGTASYGGASGAGTLFKVNTDGTGYTVLHSFGAGSGPRGSIADWYSNPASDGALPQAGLVLSSNTLYGTAPAGGSSGAGTVFRVNTDGTGYTALHEFTSPSVSYPLSNTDGAYPAGGLILSGNTLYGTAAGGGSSGAGTVFALRTDGTGFTTLHHFAASPNQGARPVAGLVLSGRTLYGTTETGGRWNYGTVFKVNTDGTGFATLHEFTDIHWCSYCANANSDGAIPYAGLVLSGNTLYGTATIGGSLGHGTLFALNTDGTSFTTLHHFAGGPSDGNYPAGGLILSGKTLYGTTQVGGSSEHGTVFSLSLPPPVARCKHVTVSADAGCVADASIDDGSFDPDGDAITLVQSPHGPYPLGDTSVTLTVTDSHGASNSCVATVTVVDTTPPVITCPGNLVTDATSPAGAVVSFAPTASENCSVATVSCSPASGSTFAIGDTTVSSTATDAAGNQATCTFAVQVKGAAEQINGLIALVQSLRLPSGTANSLVVKLQSAASALDRGNVEAACGNLGAFLNEANAQKGKKLTAAQGDLLNAEATRIRAVLGCR